MGGGGGWAGSRGRVVYVHRGAVDVGLTEVGV